MTRSFWLGIWVIVGVVLWGIVFVDIHTDKINQTRVAQAYDKGVKASIGQPIKYGNLPAGGYKILSVVPQAGLAVVEKDLYAASYFLVQDIPTSMLVLNARFSITGWAPQ